MLKKFWIVFSILILLPVLVHADEDEATPTPHHKKHQAQLQIATPTPQPTIDPAQLGRSVINMANQVAAQLNQCQQGIRAMLTLCPGTDKNMQFDAGIQACVKEAQSRMTATPIASPTPSASATAPPQPVSGTTPGLSIGTTGQFGAIPSVVPSPSPTP